MKEYHAFIRKRLKNKEALYRKEVVMGLMQGMTEENLDNETRRQCNEVILQNSELLLKLINDVIDLSSLEFGKIQILKKATALLMSDSLNGSR